MIENVILCIFIAGTFVFGIMNAYWRGPIGLQLLAIFILEFGARIPHAIRNIRSFHPPALPLFLDRLSLISLLLALGLMIFTIVMDIFSWFS